MSDVNERFAALLRRSLEQQGLTKADLAGQLGLSSASISHYTSGKTVPWRFMPQLIQVFGWTSEALLDALGWYAGGATAHEKPGTQQGDGSRQGERLRRAAAALEVPCHYRYHTAALLRVIADDHGRACGCRTCFAAARLAGAVLAEED